MIRRRDRAGKDVMPVRVVKDADRNVKSVSVYP